jgi:hypothetical protein
LFTYFEGWQQQYYILQYRVWGVSLAFLRPHQHRDFARALVSPKEVTVAAVAVIAVVVAASGMIVILMVVILIVPDKRRVQFAVLRRYKSPFDVDTEVGYKEVRKIVGNYRQMSGSGILKKRWI